MRISLQILAIVMVLIITIVIFGSFGETTYVFLQSFLKDSILAQEIEANLKHFFTFLFPRFITDTFFVSMLVLLLSGAIGVSLAYLVANYNFFLSKILEKILFLPLAIPAYILAFVYVGLMDFGGFFYTIFNFRVDFFNLYGVVFVLSISLFPYVYIFAKTSFQTESILLYEVAKTMKYSEWEIFYKISLILSRPAILAGLLLILMETLSDYGASAYLGIDTFSAGIFKLWYDLNDPYSSSVLTAILMSFVLLLMGLEQKIKNQKKYSFNHDCKTLIKRKTLSPIKSFFAFTYCFIIAFLGFLLPLCWLLYWGLQDPKLFEKNFYLLAWNSFYTAVLAAFFCVLCALLLCFVMRIGKTCFFSTFIKQASSLGYAIPGAVIGVSMMIIASLLTYYSDIQLLGISLSLLIFGYIIRFLASAIYSIQSGYDKIHHSIDEASLTLNKNDLVLWFKIHIPLLKHFIFAAFLIVFIDTIKELPLTRMLSPFGFESLSTKAFWYATDERLYEAALPSLLIVLLSLIGIVIVNFWTRKDDVRN